MTSEQRPNLVKKKFEDYLLKKKFASRYVRMKPAHRPIHPDEIKQIKKSASTSWKEHTEGNNRSCTTYNGLHSFKVLDEPTKTRVRPSSSSRLNKPHPAEVFLVTRLNEIDGCFNLQDAAEKRYGGKSQANLDKYVSVHRRALKGAMRAKPLSRPGSSLEFDPHKKVGMQTIMGRVSENVTDSWIKLNGKGLELANHLRRQPLKHSTKEIVVDGEKYRIVNFAPDTSVTKTRKPFPDFQIHPEWHTPWHKKYGVIKYQ